MTVKRWLNERPSFIDANGDPYSGGKLYFYEAGSSTPEATYNSDAGDTPNANPVILDSAGRPTSEIWLTGGQAYKVKLTDADDVEVWTEDDVTGTNDLTNDVSEWVPGTTPTYISSSSFSVAGDQTSVYTVGRRVKVADSGGTKYGTIATSAYTSLTTITLDGNSDSLASQTLTLEYGIINPTNTSLPILDEDDMASDSAVSATTQQSIKAYINTKGTWTPSVGGTATYTTQQGRYIKIGKLVWVQGDITINNLGSGSANTISGLPFQAFQSSSPLSITIASGLAISVVSIVALTGGGTSNITFSGRTAAATGTSNTMNVIASGTSISFAGCYESTS